MTRIVHAALFRETDDIAAGPFESKAEGDEVMRTDVYDDVYMAEVDAVWFAARWAEIAGEAGR